MRLFILLKIWKLYAHLCVALCVVEENITQNNTFCWDKHYSKQYIILIKHHLSVTKSFAISSLITFKTEYSIVISLFSSVNDLAWRHNCKRVNGHRHNFYVYKETSTILIYTAAVLLNVRLTKNMFGIVLTGGWCPLSRVSAALLDSRLPSTDRWCRKETPPNGINGQ